MLKIQWITQKSYSIAQTYLLTINLIENQFNEVTVLLQKTNKKNEMALEETAG